MMSNTGTGIPPERPAALHPTGVLHNTATGRYHPILFYAFPRPSEAGETLVRHRSMGHHTLGFETLEEAVAWISSRSDLRATGLVWEWDGTGTPAMTTLFETSVARDGGS